MNASPLHEVKSASAVIADDVICQSFIQSSSTLAYACLLVRNRKYDLADHVLHSLEAKQASRFKDMVFYLQAQIGIETEDFAAVKKRLLPRVNQHPNDLVALSLLECCIYQEYQEWEKMNPPAATPSHESESFQTVGTPIVKKAHGSSFGNAEAAAAAAYAASFSDAGPAVFAGDKSAPTLMPQAASVAPVASLFDNRIAHPVRPPQPNLSRPAPEPATGGTSSDKGSALNLEFGLLQSVANDASTQALVAWNHETGKRSTAIRNPQLEALSTVLPHELPTSVQNACLHLESGAIHKICFSFQHLTVSSFHADSENLGLVTGNINQSLLTIVRAENSFRKQGYVINE